MLPPDRIITVRPGGVAALSVRRQRDRATRFGYQMGLIGEFAHGGANLVLRHRDHPVEHLLQVRERQFGRL